MMKRRRERQKGSDGGRKEAGGDQSFLNGRYICKLPVDIHDEEYRDAHLAGQIETVQSPADPGRHGIVIGNTVGSDHIQYIVGQSQEQEHTKNRRLITDQASLCP